ncbi:phosphate ABC transporter permease PstA [Phytohabitans suffuscus]|uniref:Phosphate transport system permease protein PstA n=1 Tax=Phytohabitans suffuscus TaxID=624315 RepID=A0A6F8YFF5_9ACTN|nr:phosphate ABC transporter permease PstA [Phytohabitans suffuscus]BCB84708.1 phosphate transport system permease protein PstA [Phytohabitans suffuscus]
MTLLKTETGARTTTVTAPPTTTVPDRRRPRGVQSPRPLGGFRTTDVFALSGGLAAALTTTGLLWIQLGPFTGLLGYIVVSWLLFVATYALLVSFDEDRPTMWDRVSTVVVHSLALVLFGVLIFVIAYTFARGARALPHLNFFTEDMRNAGPLDPLTVGGIKHAIIGTLIELGLSLAVSVPLGLLGGVFLHEIPGRFSRFVRTVVEAMTALPDLLAGLFIFATVILIFGLDKSGLAAALALSVTMLPIIIRATDVVLRLVPGSLTEAAYALGCGQWRTVWHVVLPTARSGLATAVILGAARGIGETSPVLITAGATAQVNVDPLHGPMMSLPLLAYTLVQNSQENMVARGFGTAATLMVLVLLLFAVARVIGGRGPGDLTARQRRRRAAASRRDLKRFGGRSPAAGDADPASPVTYPSSPAQGEIS